MKAESGRFSDIRDMAHVPVHIKDQLNEQVDVAVKLGLYLDRDTNQLSSQFSSVRPGKCQDITFIR
jgi:hypothetical protein